MVDGHRAAFGELLRGRFAASEALSAAGPGWAAAVHFERFFAGLEGAPPEFDAPTVLDEAARGDLTAGLVARRWALAAALGWDRTLLEADIPERRGALSVARGLQALMRGEPPAEVDPEDPGSPDHPALIIDAVVIRALSSLARGDLEGARASARRAFRMARAEGLPQAQYLAGLTLARYRRLSGQPDLALRIVRGLAAVVQPPWQRWLTWEAALAGGAAAAEIPGLDWGEASAPTPGGRLASIVATARRGDLEAFDAEVLALRAEALPAPHAADLDRVLSALDPRVTLGPEHPGYALRHTDVPIPWGLEGLSADDPAAPGAAVCMSPGAPATRVLFAGAALFGGPALVEHAMKRKKTGRTESALVTLCLSGPRGMSEDDFFQTVYGFPYERSIHRAILGVLVHRMRAWLEGVAELERGDRLHITPLSPFVVPDAKTAREVAAQVVRFLANRSTASAKEAGSSLGVSLRSAQQALTDLVADGACERVRVGRATTYQLTDTTFQDPTEHGLGTK